ncbi:MAG: sulfite exporter TauE/SafE family protein [Acidimicrobiales bacterium]
MISGFDAGVLVAAGALAGLVGTAGGITSLVSYPALLAVGLTPLSASVTNIVALVACWPGSALASRPELGGTGPWFRRWAPVAVAGGLVGSGLLLSTSAGAFSEIVPYLVLAAALSLLAQPRFTAWQERRGYVSGRLVLGCGLFMSSAYNGYFGAGSGIMVLALLLLSVERDTARANALKNMLVGVATVLSAFTLVAFGHVEWIAAGALGLGAFLGATIGPVVARRIPGDVLRWLASLAGIALALRLWIAPL